MNVYWLLRTKRLKMCCLHNTTFLSFDSPNIFCLIYCMSHFIFIDIFTTLPNFTSLCPCQPRCERDSYGIVVSTAPLSQFASTQFIYNGETPEDYEAALHIQVMITTYSIRYQYFHSNQMLSTCSWKADSEYFSRTNVLHGFR